MQLRRQLATIQKGELSMVDYFTKVKGFTDALAAARKQLDDEDIIIYLLTGLDSSYDPLVTSVTTRAEAISLNDVYSHMLDFEIRHQHNDHAFQLPGPGGPSVNHISRNSGGGGGGSGDTGGNRPRNSGGGGGGGNDGNGGNTNRTCNSPGHNHTHGCGAPNAGRNTGKSDVFCQLCKRARHDDFDCYRRFDHSFVRKERSINNVSTGQGFDPAWYLDSGATDHITGDLGKLMMHERYTGKDQVQAANESGSGFEEGSSSRGH
ncbi:ATP-dependent RNA helicase glh-2-like [Triticum aestivum]|uniref:ATP-dependent RNA helicase glh-2-like n=1 Tax=Triticum aestivum TaxID=4565 RepID=UPI001D02E4AA|nr:ATP-dependent RNA helicase glh-2-like [Triticum aestivum]